LYHGVMATDECLSRRDKLEMPQRQIASSNLVLWLSLNPFGEPRRHSRGNKKIKVSPTVEALGHGLVSRHRAVRCTLPLACDRRRERR